MNKLGWIISGLGALLIFSSLLYPLDVIEKNTFLVLLLGGAGIMFVGTMIRAFLGNKK
ncbi:MULTISPECIES: hypothetical protein [Peribacillus]|uniref:Uncharacterized protein n=1 Tax=Peribacillus asahii TaxID=228899 RepID=A0A3Q9RN12_9BACI|nr:hypothetical protein [Peribacillus asahii]AZV42546.1 hypothetical protein BAOM_1937 [Peribacillus asahii]USK71946.1 hypothetical protein LIS76_09415 [Peribacillus asahii]USK86824.1 hypothetical protein LIT35_09395 [Peribacillus asahii]